MVDSQLINTAQPGSNLTFTEHDAILQTLDRESNGIFLNKEAFVPTVEQWQNVPLIYSSKAIHPDPAAYDKDPQAELARIGGKLIEGKVAQSYIDQTGHPRLMGKLLLSDQEIEAGIRAGKISTSTGMKVPHDGTKLKGTVAPHHILFFKEEGGNLPGDLGVFILNTADSQAEKVKLIDRLKALLLGGPNETKEGAMDMGNAELENQVAQAMKEAGDAKLAFTNLQAQVSQMEQAVKAKDAEIAQLKADNLAFVAKEKDAKWLAFKGKYVAPGLVADADKEKALRSEFESDPLAFTMKMLDQAKAQPADQGKGAEPLAFVAPKPQLTDQKFSESLAKAGIPSLEIIGDE
jgi:hypothetical protein